jgi:hypothetical protein
MRMFWSKWRRKACARCSPHPRPFDSSKTGLGCGLHLAQAFLLHLLQNIRIDVLDLDGEDIALASEFSDVGFGKEGLCEVQPAPKTIRLIQDKYLQKAYLSERGIPVAPCEKLPESALTCSISTVRTSHWRASSRMWDSDVKRPSG